MLSCWVSEHLADKLVRLARRNERSLSGEMRVALDRHLDRELVRSAAHDHEED